MIPEVEVERGRKFEKGIWNWDSTRALYFGRSFVSIVLYDFVFPW